MGREIKVPTRYTQTTALLQEAKKAKSVQVPQLPGVDIKFSILFIKVHVLLPSSHDCLCYDVITMSRQYLSLRSHPLFWNLVIMNVITKMVHM